MPRSLLNILVALILSLKATQSQKQHIRSLKCECGKKAQGSAVSVNIVFNGQDADSNDHPWQMFVRTYIPDHNNPLVQIGSMCGGALISRKHVLTAGHCVTDAITGEVSKDRVVKVSQPAGTKSMKPGLKTEIDVIKISVHPAYSVGPPVNYDYAVLTLDKEASPQQIPICLPMVGTKLDFAGEELTTVGMGKVNNTDKSYSEILQEAKMIGVADDMCSYANVLTNSMLCASGTKTRSTTCQGDSGGPLAWLNPDNDRAYIVGIVSYGDGQCSAGKHHQDSVFARVTSELGWIIREAEDEPKKCAPHSESDRQLNRNRSSKPLSGGNSDVSPSIEIPGTGGTFADGNGSILPGTGNGGPGNGGSGIGGPGGPSIGSPDFAGPGNGGHGYDGSGINWQGNGSPNFKGTSNGGPGIDGSDGRPRTGNNQFEGLGNGGLPGNQGGGPGNGASNTNHTRPFTPARPGNWPTESGQGSPATVPPNSGPNNMQPPGGIQPNPGGIQPNPGGIQPYPGGIQPNPGGIQTNPDPRNWPSQNIPKTVPPNGGIQANPGVILPYPGGIQPNPGGNQQNPGQGNWPNSGNEGGQGNFSNVHTGGLNRPPNVGFSRPPNGEINHPPNGGFNRPLNGGLNRPHQIKQSRSGNKKHKKPTKKTAKISKKHGNGKDRHQKKNAGRSGGIKTAIRKNRYAGGFRQYGSMKYYQFYGLKPPSPLVEKNRKQNGNGNSRYRTEKHLRQGGPLHIATSKHSPANKMKMLKGTIRTSNYCDCGQIKSTDVVLNGYDSSNNDHPWQVYLQINNPAIEQPSFCGGSLISKRHVLTAAHCVTMTSSLKIPDGLVVTVYKPRGRDTSKAEHLLQKERTSINATNIVFHSGYDGSDKDYAVLTLEREPGPDQIPICLPKGIKSNFTGEDLKVVGMGMWSEGPDLNKTLPDILQEATMVGKEESLCFFKDLSYNKMCVTSKDGSYVCRGDSGGPLEWRDPNDHNRTYIVGIASQTNGSCKGYMEGADAIYARVTTGLDWILQQTGNEPLKCLHAGNNDPDTAAEDEQTTITNIPTRTQNNKQNHKQNQKHNNKRNQNHKQNHNWNQNQNQNQDLLPQPVATIPQRSNFPIYGSKFRHQGHGRYNHW